MAIVYELSLSDKKLKYVSNINNSWRFTKTSDSRIVFNFEKLESLVPADIERLKSEYKGYDIFYNDKPMLTDLHYHTGSEVRIILKGTAIFYIPIEDSLYILECGPLDKITINSEVVHWFSSEGPITALRLFSENEVHIEHHPENTTKEILDIKSMLKYGFKFDI